MRNERLRNDLDNDGLSDSTGAGQKQDLMILMSATTRGWHDDQEVQQFSLRLCGCCII